MINKQATVCMTTLVTNIRQKKSKKIWKKKYEIAAKLSGLGTVNGLQFWPTTTASLRNLFD